MSGTADYIRLKYSDSYVWDFFVYLMGATGVKTRPARNGLNLLVVSEQEYLRQPDFAKNKNPNAKLASLKQWHLDS